MRIGLLDIERIIQINGVKEVTSPLMLSNKMLYDPNGIFSNEIFGMSKTDRRSTYGYIDLKGTYLHPHVYLNVLKKGVYRDIVSLVNGTKKFDVINKELVLSEDGWTGVFNLYKHWDEIDWKRLKSTDATSIELLSKLKKDEAFITKFLVCPPAYRDIMIGGTVENSDKIHELNTFYTAIIRAVNMLQEGGIFSRVQYMTQAKVQELLADVTNYCQSQISKKSGLIRQYLLGKRVDYGTRSVISAYSYNNETIKDNMIGLEYTALPISQCCAAFMPFIENWLKSFFTRDIINTAAVPFIDPKTNKEYSATIKSPDIQFSDKEINKMILDYVKNPNNRFKPIEVICELYEGGYQEIKMYLLLKGKKMNRNNAVEVLNRPMTITDLLYLACCDVCERRHVVITRYPVGTDKGLFINRINVQSTRNHIKLIYNNKEYSFYPDIDMKTPHDQVGVQFIDTVVFSNSMLKGLGGD